MASLSSAGKESACNTGDPSLIPGLGRSTGDRNGYTPQYSDLENFIDCILHGSQRVGHDWVTFTSLSLIHEKNYRTRLSVQFSRSVVSDSLQPHESQHARPPCPSPTPGVHQNLCPSSCWCHPAISSSVVPFSSCLQSLPALGSFPMSQLFAWGGQSIRVSASASVLPVNIQDRYPLGWTGWISLQPKGLSRVFSNTTVQKHPFFGTQLSSQSNSHIHTWPQEKP